MDAPKGATADIKGTKNVQVEYIARSLIDPSPWNPRKHFDEAKLAELRASTRQHGIQVPLIVRLKREETTAKGETQKLAIPRYELVDGERRFRASAAGSLPENNGVTFKADEMKAVPCIVSEMSDDDAREIQLTANLQREDLTDLEEAEGFHAMLQLKHDDGKPRYTVAALATALGRSTDRVYAKLKLMNLPEEARAAFEAKQISLVHAEIIGRVPGLEARKKLTQEILHPKYSSAPLSVAATRDLVSDEYTQPLAKASFDPEDEALVPIVINDAQERVKGGKCSTCPFRSGNLAERKASVTAPTGGKNGNLVAGGTAAANVCTNLDCFKAKEEAEWDQWAAKHTDPAKHKKAISRTANANVFQNWGGPTDLNYNSPWVKLADKPEDSLLTDKVKPKEVLPWRTLITGREAKIVVARTKTGSAIELVDRVQAIAAAKLNEHKIFAAEAGQKKVPESKMTPEQVAKEKAKAERELNMRKAVFERAMDSLVLAIQKNPDTFAAAFLEFTLDNCKYRKEQLKHVVARRKLPAKTDLMEYGSDLKPGEQLALAVELEIVTICYDFDLADCEFATPLISAFKIDLKSIEAQIKKLVTDKEAEDAKATASKAAEATAARAAELKARAADLASKRKAGKFGDEDVIVLLELAGAKGLTAIELAGLLPSTYSAAMAWFAKGTTKKIKGLALGGVLNDSRHVYTPPAVEAKAAKPAKKAGKK